MKNTKTYSAKPSEVERQWLLLDASETTLGRLSTVAARYLTGKGKPMYTPNIDCGDFVVIINADKLKVTGSKLLSKKYYRHSGYPGALKTIDLKSRMVDDSTGVIKDAIKGMLPKNKLQSGRLARLKVFAGSEHDHRAQEPQKTEVRSVKPSAIKKDVSSEISNTKQKVLEVNPPKLSKTNTTKKVLEG